MKGKLIVFEGLDGSGKTTQQNLLKQKLELYGYKVRNFRELSSCAECEALQNIILNPNRVEDCDVDVYLWLAAKKIAQRHLREALEQHDFVLMDRYLLSFIIMQGSMNKREVICRKETENFIDPHLTFYLKWPVESLIKNLAKTGKEPDYFESRGGKYFKALHLEFEKWTSYPAYKRIAVIDCVPMINVRHRTLSIDEIHQQIFDNLRYTMRL